jgi:LysR family transcriptional regulator, nitrogen assimilation regulatory protein
MTLNLRQLRAFVAVYEEGSFNRAAKRENATQSGMSTLVGNLEVQIGLRVFERNSRGVVPTQAGERLYRKSTAIMRDLGEAESELRLLAGDVAGHIRIGLIPSVTYSLLAPVLAEFGDRYPAVDVTIVEAYGSALTDSTARKDFDFAIVPADRVEGRIKTSFFGREGEFLVSSRRSPLEHMEPVQLKKLPPLKLILPTHGNVRRERFEAYFAENDVKIASIMSIDAMLATLELVGRREWMTILPAVILRGDMSGRARTLNPIISPKIELDYAVIEPRGKTLSLSARLFLDMLKSHFDAHLDRLGSLL